MHPIVAHALAETQRSYTDMYGRLLALVQRLDQEHRDLVFRLLTSRGLYYTMGSRDPNGIGHGYDFENPMSRMAFVRWFVGHEIRDDGMPIVQWHKYNPREGRFEACGRTTIQAWAYIHHTVDEYPDDYEIVDATSVNALLDQCEERDLRRALFVARRRKALKRTGLHSEPPVYALMEGLVEELRQAVSD